MSEKLNRYHIAIMIHFTQIGIGLYSLPNLAAQGFGTNGWISILGISLLAMLNIWLISLVYTLGKKRSVFDILSQSLPNWLLYPFYFALAMVWGIFALLLTKDYVMIYQLISFPTTSPILFQSILLLLTFFLVRKGIYNIAKASTIFFYLTIWMLALLGFHVSHFDLVRLTPFFFKGDTNFLKGFVDVYTAFLGYELAILLFPYMESKHKSVRAFYIGNAFTTVSYFMVTFVCFGFFSFGQLIKMKFPVMELMAYIELPFLERVDNILFAILLISVMQTAAMYLWAAKEALGQIFNHVNSNWLLIIIIIVPFAVSLIPSILRDVEQWLNRVASIEAGIAFCLPLFMLIVLLIQHLRRRKVNA